MTIWLMRIACWITKSINTHSEYVILIAFPLQQWLHDRASMLRYTYTASLVYHIPLSTINTVGVNSCRLLVVPTSAESWVSSIFSNLWFSFDSPSCACEHSSMYRHLFAHCVRHIFLHSTHRLYACHCNCCAPTNLPSHYMHDRGQ